MNPVTLLKIYGAPGSIPQTVSAAEGRVAFALPVCLKIAFTLEAA